MREAAHLMGVSQSTVRRRVEQEALRGRTGKSGRQEVFLPAKLRRELEAKQAEPCTPGHLQRGKGACEEAAQPNTTSKTKKKPAATKPDVKPSEEQPGGDDVLKRYERLAGGSLILAQQHADELKGHAEVAYEQLAHTRSQVRQLRKVAWAGWSVCAATVLFAMLLTVGLGVGKARAESRAAASEHMAQEAERRIDGLTRALARTPRAEPGADTQAAAVSTDEVLFGR